MKKVATMLTWASLLAGLASTLAPGSASGVPDVIGIYFDTEAMNHCVSLPPGEHHAYLIVTNLVDPGGIGGWECRILTDGPLVVTQWDLLWEGINVFPPPGFGVGLVTPMPRQEIMVLLEITFQLLSTEEVDFFIHPWFQPSLEDVPVYASGLNPGILRPLHQSTGGPDDPVAVINGDCPVQDEVESWGGIKALYR